LQAAPFAKLASPDLGRIKIEYREVPCTFEGGVIAHVDSYRSSGGGWVRMSFKNVNGAPLEKVEIAKVGWAAGRPCLGGDGTWHGACHCQYWVVCARQTVYGAGFEYHSGRRSGRFESSSAATLLQGLLQGPTPTPLMLLLPVLTATPQAGSDSFRPMQRKFGAAFEASRLPALPWDIKLTNTAGDSIVLT
jgi:hypothetical protein